MSSPKFTIVYDTYCGWCYGASNVLDAIVDSGAEVEVLHRYLFQGDNAPRLADGYSAHMATADERIGALSGLEFSSAYVENVQQSPTEVLESGFTADAAALVSELGPAQELKLAKRLQERRYVDGISASNRDDIVATLIEVGLDEQTANQVGTHQVRGRSQDMARRAVAAMADVGAVGVPAVIRHGAATSELLEVGRFYQNPEAIIRNADLGMADNA